MKFIETTDNNNHDKCIQPINNNFNDMGANVLSLGGGAENAGLENAGLKLNGLMRRRKSWLSSVPCT